MTAQIDFRDNCWFVTTPNGDFGFWTLEAALSFALKTNIPSPPPFSNRALVKKYASAR